MSPSGQGVPRCPALPRVSDEARVGDGVGAAVFLLPPGSAAAALILEGALRLR